MSIMVLSIWRKTSSRLGTVIGIIPLIIFSGNCKIGFIIETPAEADLSRTENGVILFGSIECGSVVSPGLREPIMITEFPSFDDFAAFGLIHAPIPNSKLDLAEQCLLFKKQLIIDFGKPYDLRSLSFALQIGQDKPHHGSHTATTIQCIRPVITFFFKSEKITKAAHTLTVLRRFNPSVTHTNDYVHIFLGLLLSSNRTYFEVKKFLLCAYS